MDKKLYIGIDVSKLKLDTSITLQDEKIIASFKVNNNFLGLEKLFEQVERLSKINNCTTMHFCLESTGIYSELPTEFLSEKENTIVSEVNPARIKGFASCENIRTKTDKTDASLIARFCARNNPLATDRKSVEEKKLKQLTRYHSTLVSSRAKEKTRLESVRNPIIEDGINQLIAAYSQQIQIIEEEINKLFETSEDFKNKIKLLTSIKSIGETTARIILASLKPQADGSYIIKSQIAHATLAPTIKESGISLNQKSGTCKKGDKRIRHALYMPTMNAIKYNKQIKCFYEKLISKGKHHMVAVVACMKKLLTICIGVLNSGLPYDPDWEEKRQLQLSQLILA